MMYSPQTVGLYQDAYVLAGNNSDLFSGIVLSTGDAFALNTNYNTDPGVSTLIGLPWDADLKNLVNGNSYDASWIEFDFVPTVTGNLYFSYMFGSDEYYFSFDQNYEKYHDVFGIFLDGTNIATLPTGENIGVNTVNQYNNYEYFNSNQYGNSMYATEMNGFTDAFTFVKPVTAGEQHTLKFGICDARDPWYDSWALFGKNSLRVEPVGGVNVPEPSTISLIIMGLIVLFGGMILKLRFKKEK